MQALEIQGIKMHALLIAMHLFFFRFVEFSMLYVSKTIVIILLPYIFVLHEESDTARSPYRDLISSSSSSLSGMT